MTRGGELAKLSPTATSRVFLPDEYRRDLGAYREAGGVPTSRHHPQFQAGARGGHVNDSPTGPNQTSTPGGGMLAKGTFDIRSSSTSPATPAGCPAERYSFALVAHRAPSLRALASSMQRSDNTTAAFAPAVAGRRATAPSGRRSA